MGDGFVESNDYSDAGSPPSTFNSDILGVVLSYQSYILATDNSKVVLDLYSASDITTSPGGPCPYPQGCNFSCDSYSVFNRCFNTNDVLEADPASLISADMKNGNRYEPRPPYYPTPLQAGMLKSFSASNPWVALTDGIDLESLTGTFGGNSARTRYVAAVLANVIGPISAVAGTPNPLLVASCQGIQIDARALADSLFRIDGIGACYNANQVQAIALSPGTHQFEVEACLSGGCGIRPGYTFNVSNGTISYDLALEPGLSGNGTNTLVVNSVPAPPLGDDTQYSVGLFQIVVEPRFWNMMAGYPGYAVVDGLHRLISPVLNDNATKIGRSVRHLDGSSADINGTPVGTAGTNVADSSFSFVPPGFQGPPGRQEIHTEMRSLNLRGGGVAVRAGTHAPTRPVSAGEIEAASGSGFYPADSFFDIWAEVDLPMLNGNALTTLYNSEPLLVENLGLTCLPPRVIYKHRHTGPVPIVFKTSDPGMAWSAGDRFGWLALAGHGYQFNGTSPNTKSGLPSLNTDLDEFLQVVNAQPEMADSATLNVDMLDLVTFASDSAFVQPSLRDSILAGLDIAAQAVRNGDECGGARELATSLAQRVDGSNDPPDWVTNPTLRQRLYDKLVELVAALQSSDSASCTTEIGKEPVPERVAIQYIHPNPTARNTSIRYGLPREGIVRLSIFDLSGRRVRTVVNGVKPAGVHWAIWDGRDDHGGVPRSGVYFARLIANGVTQSRRIVVTR